MSALSLVSLFAAFLPDLAAALTANLLGTTARGLRRRLTTPRRQEALNRCNAAALEALLATAAVDGEDEANLLAEVLTLFFTDPELGPEVAREVGVLLRGEKLDQDSLAELFEEAEFDAATLPGIDLSQGFTAFEAAFVLTAKQEPALQGEIQLYELEKQTGIHEKQLETQKEILGRMPPPPPAEDLRGKYLESLILRCRYLPLGPLGDKYGLETRITLDQVFIEQGVLGATDPDVLPAAMGPSYDAESSQSPASLCPKLVLTAAAGGGKSSFAKELLARQAEVLLGLREAGEGQDPELLPVLIELRKLGGRLRSIREEYRGSELQEQLAQALVLHAVEALEDRRAEGFGKDLQAAMEEGRCLLVLDGLDEVAPDLRATAKQAVELAVRRFELRRVIVTSRTLSYTGSEPLDGFEHHGLAPLTEEQIAAFAEAWYGAQAGNLGTVKAVQWGHELAEAAVDDSLRELASNPMLLTAMALVHQEQHKLPRERACLYYRAVDVLAYRWQDHKEGDEAVPPELLAKLGEDLRRWKILEHLGYSAHCARETSRKPEQGGELDEGTLLRELKQPGFLGSAALAEAFLAYIDQKAGLLVGEGTASNEPRTFRFAHQTFQEYLAGRYLATRAKPLEALRTHVERSDFWNLPTRFGTEDLLHERKQEEQFLGIAKELNPSRQKDTKAFWRSVLLSGAMAGEVGRDRLESEPERFGVYLKKLRQRLKKITSGSLTPVERIEAGRLLGKLGEPDDALTSVARMELCWVPPGRFFFSGAEEGEEAEGAFVELPYGYWIGRFPVTQGQFEEFRKAGGYDIERYWPEAINAGLWNEKGFEGRWDDEPRKGPFQFREPYSASNHPVVGVSWYEMLAFCRWLTELAQKEDWIGQAQSFCLPSEMEWEKAARGGEQLPQQSRLVTLASEPRAPKVDPKDNPEPKRAYPWQGGETDDRGNFGGFDTTSRPGTFPKGRSPYGCEEMAGNVWEWTRSLRDKGRGRAPTSAEEIEEELGGGPRDWRFLCGGSYYQSSSSVGCSARFRYYPYFRLLYFGFRVVLLPFPSGL